MSKNDEVLSRLSSSTSNSATSSHSSATVKPTNKASSAIPIPHRPFPTRAHRSQDHGQTSSRSNSRPPFSQEQDLLSVSPANRTTPTPTPIATAKNSPENHNLNFDHNYNNSSPRRHIPTPSASFAPSARGAASPALQFSNAGSHRETNRRMSDFQHYRRDLAVLETSSSMGGGNAGNGRLPQQQQQQQQQASGMAASGSAGGRNAGGVERGSMPSNLQSGGGLMSTSFYNDDSDMSPLSPAFRTGAPARHSQQIPSVDPTDIAPWAEDERRPSLASITTASSQGSKNSVRRGGLQKLQGFFGEEFPGRDSSETSLQSSMTGKDRSGSYSHGGRQTRERNFSNATDQTRDASPSSRPRTPVPAPEVVPFLYQNSDDIARLGEAPVGEMMTGPDRQRYEYSHNNPQGGPPKTSSSARSGQSTGQAASQPHHQQPQQQHHHHHHHHRHNKSIDDGRSLRPTPSREDSVANLQAPNTRERGGSAATVMYGSSKNRAQSPTPSTSSNNYFSSKPGPSDGQTSPNHHSRRRILNPFKRHKDHKEEQASNSGTATPSNRPLNSLPGSTRSLATKASRAEIPRTDASATFPPNWPGANERGNDDADRPRHPRAATFHNRFPFKSKKSNRPAENPEEHIGPTDRQDGNGTVFHLDTNLNDMDGILQKPPPLTPMDNTFISSITEPERADIKQPPNLNKPEPPIPGPPAANGNGSWNAPDSWAVRRGTEDNTYHVPDTEDIGSPPRPDEKKQPYCIRIFKNDGTFTTLSMSLDASVADAISQIIKKSYAAEGPDNFQITLTKHGLVRVLAPNERPILMQKRILQQAGYEEKDRIEDLGREDNSYLCRFTFLSQKDSDFHSKSNEAGFGRMAKFNHVDLSGRNLVTVPIALYSKASEIISLNLSRNLSIDLPRDFIQSCQNLRDIKFNNNEARKLPPSLGKAVKLTYLDASNNRLEGLEHGGLENLSGILKINLANNRLKALPAYFGAYQSLRNLNLSSNFLEVFPQFLCKVESLVELDLSFNTISSLPQDIGDMRSLEKFVITNNRLSNTPPDTLRHLQMLRELDIKYNAITNIDTISDLPRLEILSADHNAISNFVGKFDRVRSLKLNSNPITTFEIVEPVPTLKMLNLSNCQLASVKESFNNVINLESLILDRNYFVSLPDNIGSLNKLEHFSIAHNSVGVLPSTIGCLSELRTLDVRGNNLKKLPMEIWWANKLESLNASSNVLDGFPKPASRQPRVGGDEQAPQGTLNGKGAAPSSQSQASASDDSDASRRPSAVSSSTLLSVGPSPVPPGPDRKSSVVSVYGKGGRKTSVVSRSTSQQAAAAAAANAPPVPPVPPINPRKDSSLSARLLNTFAGSLRNLLLADNQMDDEIFDEITGLNELRVLNLSYNEISDVPQRSIKAWPQLVELYLSGNDLTTLPADDLEDASLLQVLHLNGNKFTNLPADISRAKKLTVLDCGSNYLKYNIANVPYDWNWNLNPKLRYLNLSGNKRLEIKQAATLPSAANRADEEQHYAGFTKLQNLRLLGLMDVTLPSPNIPEQNEDRRVRTSGSLAGHLPYGMADTLGKNEHLSTMDLVVPRFNASDTETLLALFDGQALSSGGSKIAKYLHENFGNILATELKNLKPKEGPEDALRRAFLSMNKDLVNSAQNAEKERARKQAKGQPLPVILSKEDLNSGGVATVVYLQSLELYVANVGDSQAMLIQVDGSHKIVTRKHDPAEPSERQRIREAGGWVSRNGKLNDYLEVSRAFGYIDLMPAVQAAPYISNFTVREQDDIIVIATRELWEYMAPGLIVDVARSERSDLMRAAQKLRDLAIAYGCSTKIMVMLLSVADLKRRVERSRTNRGQSMSLYPSGVPDDLQNLPRRGKKTKGDVLDSTLQRLEAEIPAPTGSISIVFTDIKNSTNLWEMYPAAMRAAIKLHNEVMRRQLRRIGGYEVKTEGDAFMVSFPTATSALLWCFAVQMQLLDVDWPTEILSSLTCQPTYDKDNALIFKGLSVRMGIHFGEAVNEMDPVTRRMDYFGPMVNKASRISAVADGGQITVSSDFISEIQRCLESSQDNGDRNGSTGSEDTFADDTVAAAIRRDLRSLSSQGFEVKEMGERKLKGLENPEVVYSLYPHALIGRAEQHQQLDRGVETADKPASLQPGSELSFDPDLIWGLWRVSLRLEMLCSSLETESGRGLQPPETELLERMKQRGGEVTERFLLNFIEHQVSRVETCTTTLALRHMATQKAAISDLGELAGPISGVLDEVALQMAELQKYKDRFGPLTDYDHAIDDVTDEGSDTELEP